MASASRRDVWSRYWATGMPHSCGGTYGDRYGGAVATFWRDAFAELRPGARILDIATGNGALPRLLLDTIGETEICCDAVDLAEISPPWVGALGADQRERLRWHSGVMAEALPFADRTFSLVVSQFGIEYADLTRAIPELLRVLESGGAVRILAHHTESQPVRLAAEEIDHIDWMLAPGGLIELAAAMLEPMARAATPTGRASLAADATANALRARFNAVQNDITERIGASACPDVLHEMRHAVATLFQTAMQLGRAPAGEALINARHLLADARVRLDELRRHALDKPAVLALQRRLVCDGLSVAYEPLSDAGRVLGWAIRAQRSA